MFVYKLASFPDAKSTLSNTKNNSIIHKWHEMNIRRNYWTVMKWITVIDGDCVTFILYFQWLCQQRWQTTLYLKIISPWKHITPEKCSINRLLNIPAIYRSMFIVYNARVGKLPKCIAAAECPFLPRCVSTAKVWLGSVLQTLAKNKQYARHENSLKNHRAAAENYL